MITDSLLQHIKDFPLVDFIGKYCLLKRDGANYLGNCPFHNEKSPSFTVSPTKGIYKCFGCGKSGANIIDFVIEMEKLPFIEATKRAASIAGIYIDETQPAQQMPIQKKAPAPPPPVAPIDTIPFGAIEANANAYRANNLYIFLAAKYGEATAERLARLYGMASCKYFEDGTTLFIQRDQTGSVRQLKAILYDPANGKRRKEKQYEPKIIGRQIMAKHTGRGYDTLNLVQTFFGQHLLEGNTKPVNLVESEKSAMICSLFYPANIWLATGGSSGCKWYSEDVCKVLAGRQVFLFPDGDKRKEWEERAIEMRAALESKGVTVKLVDIIGGGKKGEDGNFLPAPEGKNKYDIADLLLDSGKQPPPQPPAAFLVNITATNCGKVFRQYATIDGQKHQILFYANGQQVPPTDKQSVKEAETATGLKFIPASLYGFGCMIAKHNN